MTARRLADAGARVIKLERPEGDFARHYDSLVHGRVHALRPGSTAARNPSSPTSPSPRTSACSRPSLAKADVLRAEPEARRAGQARLSHGGAAQATIPGSSAARSRATATTAPTATARPTTCSIQAESGLASVTGGPEAPARVGVSIVDICTGMNAYEAILEALIARGRTGEGADIRVSMFDSMMEWMAVPMLSTEYGAPPKRIGSQPHRARALRRVRDAPTRCRSSSPSRTTASGWCSAPRCWAQPELRTRSALCHQHRTSRQPGRDRRPDRSAASAAHDVATLSRLLGEGRDRLRTRQRYGSRPAPPSPASPDYRLAQRSRSPCPRRRPAGCANTTRPSDRCPPSASIPPGCGASFWARTSSQAHNGHPRPRAVLAARHPSREV